MAKRRARGKAVQAVGARRARAAPLAACAALLVALCPPPALAQRSAGARGAATDEAKELARVLANRAYELYAARKLEDALKTFQAAEKQFHAPTITLMIARTQAELGHLLEARAVYERIRDEELVNYAPREFFEAQKSAAQELAALERRIPSVRLAVRGARDADARILLDGAPAAPSAWLPLDPGRHTVDASAPGHGSITRTIVLAEGAREEIELDLGPPPPPAPPERAAPPAEGSLVPAFIAFGAGALGLGVGAVTGAMSLSKVSELDAACPNRTCARALEGTYDDARTLETVSIVGFVVGGAATAAGVVLLVVRPGGGAPAQVGLSMGPAWIGARGTF